MLYVVGGSCKVIALLTEKVGKVTSDGMRIIIRFISVTTRVFVCRTAGMYCRRNEKLVGIQLYVVRVSLRPEFRIIDDGGRA